MALLRVTNLQILDLPPISIEVHNGDCLAVTGPSGCGKSLFLRALADLDPHNGDLFLDDEPLASYQPWQWRQQVGFLPAESSWWFATVADHFKGEAVHLYQQLAEIGLTANIIDYPTHLLSSGERQRLALIRLLQNQPKVLLLDEPTANLDARNASLVERTIKAFQHQQGAALIWVTHDLRQARRVATRHLLFGQHTVREVQKQ